ncbi:MAG: hypothetical protein EZS28_010963 [Streblomastix strix]|uniref:DDE-1 domain-containing protein n=1 Tax=Streblomastix strix TaxID=222440 RepID=A0A5J4WF70_9EUKA|nr:MAG: hypothetical protein EZS28_010963 [Streblomastix strix]
MKDSTKFSLEATRHKNITMLLAIAADGEFLPVHFIFPSINVPKDVLFLASDKRILNVYPSGWMTCMLFTEIMLESIIPAMEKRRIEIGLTKKQHILLMLDSNQSKLNHAIWRRCKQANMDAITFKSHTTEICQACDCEVLRAFKKSIHASQHFRTYHNRRQVSERMGERTNGERYC